MDHRIVPSAFFVIENICPKELEENCVRRIIFDFEKTEFMDSSGIGVLLNRYKEMKASRGSVCYCRASRRVRRLMELSGICRLMEGYESREQAVGALK